MNNGIPNKSHSTSTTEALFAEYLNSGNRAILEQIRQYKKTADIYERTQVALGRRITFKSASSSTESAKIHLYIGATNQI